MNLILVIESATRQASVALGRGREVLYSIEADAGNRDLAGLLRTGLETIGQSVDAIDLIAVNIGPGGLSSVRCGAAFANALAFSLKKPLLPFNSFELLGFCAQQDTDLPVLCTSKAADGKAFVGLYDRGKLERLNFGPFEAVVTEATHGLDRFAVAGSLRSKVVKFLRTGDVHDTGLAKALADQFLAMADPVGDRAAAFTDLAHPINDQSELFNSLS